MEQKAMIRIVALTLSTGCERDQTRNLPGLSGNSLSHVKIDCRSQSWQFNQSWHIDVQRTYTRALNACKLH